MYIPKAIPRKETRDYSAEVQNAITKYATMCHNASSGRCEKCAWRARQASNALSDAAHLYRDKQSLAHQGEEEFDLELYSSGNPTPQELVDRAERTHDHYDVRKVRALFGFGPEPPRLKTYPVRTLDKKRFIQRPGEILAEHHVESITSHLRCAAAETSLMSANSAAQQSPYQVLGNQEPTTSKMMRMPSKGHRHRAILQDLKENAIKGREVCLHAMNFKTALGASGLSSQITRPQGHRIIGRMNKLHDSFERRQQEKREDAGGPQAVGSRTGNGRREGDFNFSAWQRATQHCAIPVEGFPIHQGEDKEWTFVVHDSLDDNWPWESLQAPSQGCVSLFVVAHNLSYEKIMLNGQIVSLFRQLMIDGVLEDIQINTRCPARFNVDSMMRASLCADHVKVTLTGSSTHVRIEFQIHPPKPIALQDVYSVIKASKTFVNTLSSKKDMLPIDKMGHVVISAVNDLLITEPLFKGLFLGVTSKPFRIGPFEGGSTLSGIYTTDGRVIHEAREYNLFNKMDTDDEGVIGFEDFASLFVEKGRSATAAWQDMDVRERGTLNVDEFKSALKNDMIKGSDFRILFDDKISGTTTLKDPCPCCPHRKEDLAPEICSPTPVLFDSGIRKVTMRLDRSRFQTNVDSTGYHARLWLHVEGENPRVIIEDLQLDSSQVVFPAVYASRPACDIIEAVRVRSCREAWLGAVKRMEFFDDSVRNRLIDLVQKDEISSFRSAGATAKLFRMFALLWSLPAMPDDIPGVHSAPLSAQTFRKSRHVSTTHSCSGRSDTNVDIVMKCFRSELKALLSVVRPETAKVLLQWMPKTEELERILGSDQSTPQQGILTEKRADALDKIIKWDEVVNMAWQKESGVTTAAHSMRLKVASSFQLDGDETYDSLMQESGRIFEDFVGA